LQDTGLDPRHLRLEITEATLLKDIELSSVLLHTLQDMGVGIALDRYGTGSSSLSHLRRFALDALKIDTSLIGGLCANPGDASAVNTVISTGKNFHLRVIAQGVETTEQLAALHEWQCDEGQGYFIHPPAPADEIACLLSRRMPPGLDLPRMATKAGVAR
jgi:EAL domain-containing protein (putative c-di-GMP-specific phosphodiesterase class I)